MLDSTPGGYVPPEAKQSIEKHAQAERTEQEAQTPVQDFFVLFDHGCNYDELENQLDRTDPIFHNAIAEQMLKKGYHKALFGIMDHLQVDQNHLAKQIMMEQNGNWLLAQALDHFQNLDVSIADQLIKDGFGSRVLNQIDHFSSLNLEHVGNTLWETHDWYILTQNLHLFPHMDKQKLIEKLFDVDRSRFVAEYIKQFDNADHARIAQKLIDQKEYDLLGRWLPHFSQIDQAVAIALLENSHTFSVIHNFDKIVISNPPELATTLMQRRNFTCLLEHLEKFQSCETEIAEYLIKHNFIGVGIENIERFNDASQELFEMAAHNKDMRSLGKNLYKFKRLHRQTADQLFPTSTHQKRVLFNVAKFDSVDGEMIERNMPNAVEVLFLELSGIRQYETLYKSLLKLKEAGIDLKKKSATIPEIFLKEELMELMLNEQPVNAWNAVLVGELLGWTLVNHATRDRLFDQVKAEQDKRASKEPQREVYKDVQLSREIVTFFTMEDLLKDVHALEQSMQPSTDNPTGTELPFRKSMDLFYLKQRIQQSIEATENWMRCYLLKAVHSELKHQTDSLQDKLKHPVVVLPERFLTIDTFIENATEEEIRTYLFAAEIQFRRPTWESSYGGEMWAKITDATNQFWKPTQNKRPTTVNIDRAFDLQHNTGMVFDKDENVHANEEREKQLLDIKYVADMRTRNAAFQQLVHDPALFQQLEAMRDAFEAIKQSVPNAKGTA
ncbi:MAG: hypothetical protein NTX72_02700 [Candidatus Uhrbacteria bacterium]|nr:hypothetical protein [Candidatus Uhrbacteria bacterium]